MGESLERKKAELDRLRPLTKPTLEVLDRWYDVELTYSSTALEGNTLTRSETAVLLEKGVTVHGKPLKDHLEAVDHREALQYVRVLAETGEPIREIDIHNIHRLVLLRSDPSEAGRYSEHQRMIAGSSLVLPSPAELPVLMHEFAGWLSKAPPEPASAFHAHLRLVTIHPFSDGNGRAARLLMNLLLLRGGFPPIVIPPESRNAYLSALERSQMSGNTGDFDQFMMNCLHAALDHYLDILTRGLTEPLP